MLFCSMTLSNVAQLFAFPYILANDPYFPQSACLLEIPTSFKDATLTFSDLGKRVTQCIRTVCEIGCSKGWQELRRTLHVKIRSQ